MKDNVKNDQFDAAQTGEVTFDARGAHPNRLRVTGEEQDRVAADKPFQGQLYHWAIYAQEDGSAAFAVGARRPLTECETLPAVPLRITSQLVWFSPSDGLVETLHSVYRLNGHGGVYIVRGDDFIRDRLTKAHALHLAKRLKLQFNLH